MLVGGKGLRKSRGRQGQLFPTFSEPLVYLGCFGLCLFFGIGNGFRALLVKPADFPRDVRLDDVSGCNHAAYIAQHIIGEIG
jgi:hypothetical protein